VIANISMPQLLIILAIVILIFGSKRLRQLGGDLGAMFSGFRKEMKDVDTKEVIKDVNKARKATKVVKKFAGK